MNEWLLSGILCATTMLRCVRCEYFL